MQCRPSGTCCMRHPTCKQWHMTVIVRPVELPSNICTAGVSSSKMCSKSYNLQDLLQWVRDWWKTGIATKGHGEVMSVYNCSHKGMAKWESVVTDVNIYASSGWPISVEDGSSFQTDTTTPDETILGICQQWWLHEFDTMMRFTHTGVEDHVKQADCPRFFDQ